MRDTSAENYLQQNIAQHGSISLGEFFSFAVSHPQHGYYASQAPFGREGDFITAPEISQMFGEMIGAWVYDTWQQLGEPGTFNLLEFGPGRGTLMSDILRVTMKSDTFRSAARISLVEVSPSLKQSQKETLSGHEVSWCAELSEINHDCPTIIIGNEFLDALPIEQLKRTEQSWQKRVIKYDAPKNEFSFDWESAEQELIALLPAKTESHQIYEVAPQRQKVIKDVCTHISASSGAALWIDYGYTKRHYGDTLQAIKKHQYSDILTNIGQSDITAHVDFQALAEDVHSHDTLSSRTTTQGEFLKKVGIEYRALALKNSVLKAHGTDNGAKKIYEIDQDLNRLISRNEMGELFKVMAIYDNRITPSGF